MTKNKGMRVKDVGATINLGNYSSLHITIGEESEFAGLDLGRAETYLRNIAKSVDGVLNLPEKDDSPTPQATALEHPQKDLAGRLVYYDHATHSYAGQNGVEYHSVTTMLGDFYPTSPYIKPQYMDFAAAFGNLIHAAIQNAVIGYPPKKGLTKAIVDQAVASIGKYDHAVVEQIIQLPAQEIAGRFDILTYADSEEVHASLYDVKTNTALYADRQCTLPPDLQNVLAEYWNPATVYGEHCLQLNIYAFILEKVYGKIIDHIKIIYVPDDYKDTIEIPKIDVSAIFQAYGSIR